MDNYYLLYIIASISSIVANINGRIIHLAIGFNFKGYYLQKIKKLLVNKWKGTKMLILNKISIISSYLFSNISNQLNYLRGYYNAKDMCFKYTPIIIILGNFTQFPLISTIFIIFPAKKKIIVTSFIIENNNELINVVLWNIIVVIK